jgi:hypothetical protein
MRLLSTLGLVVVAKYTSIWEIKQQGCMISSDGDNKHTVLKMKNGSNIFRKKCNIIFRG